MNVEFCYFRGDEICFEIFTHKPTSILSGDICVNEMIKLSGALDHDR